MWKFQGVWALGLMSPMQSISRKHVGIKRHSSHKLIIEKQAKNCLISTYWIIFNNFISTVDKNTLLYLNISTLRGRRQQPFSPLLPQTEKKKMDLSRFTYMDGCPRAAQGSGSPSQLRCCVHEAFCFFQAECFKN